MSEGTWKYARGVAGTWRMNSLVQGIYRTADTSHDRYEVLRPGGKSMTVAEHAALDAPWIDSVREWRLEELVRAGYELEDATEIAFHLDIDLHQATDLVRGGCPSATAVKIVG